MADKSVGYIADTKQTKVDGLTVTVTSDKEQNVGERPGGMDNIPSTFNVGKKADKGKTDMGKVAKIAHVNVKDRGVKGVSSSQKGGGRK